MSRSAPLRLRGTRPAVSREQRVDLDLLRWLRVGAPALLRVELDRLQLAVRGRGTTTYLVARDHHRRPLALLPVYVVAPPWDGTIDMIGDLAATIDADYPRVCVAGSLGVPANHLLTNPVVATAVRLEAVAAVLDEASRVAAENGCQRLLMASLDRDQFEAVQTVDSAAFVGPVQEKAVLHVQWTSFEQYVAWLPARRRTPVRRERRRFAESGIEVRERPVGEVAAQVAPLIAATQTKYGQTTGVDQIEFHYRMTALASGDHYRALLAYRSGKLVACSLLSTLGPHWVSRAWGRSDSDAGTDLLYFNLNFYEPISLAMACGASTIDYGLGSLEAKIQRGCKLEPLQSILLEVAP